MPVQQSRVAVFGASGFSGAELLRLLADHPAVEVTALGANERAGERVDDVHPHLSALGDRRFEALDDSVAERADVAFLALPRGASAPLAPVLVERGMRVVDLTGDFRLPAEAYPAWYGFEHPAPEWLGRAVYGLPETHRDEIAGARLVANPGCFATAAILALAPLLRAGLVAPDGLVIDAKTGVSGAGATPTPTVHYAHVEGSVRPYRVGTHQHTPEIEGELTCAAGSPVRVTFVPHLVPAVRGILATCYGRATGAAAEAGGEPAARLTDALTAAYAEEPFVRVLPPGAVPDPKRVTASNVAEVACAADPRTGTVVAMGAIDNLVKGAAGQAVQNLNVMLGLDQATGLPTVGVYP